MFFDIDGSNIYRILTQLESILVKKLHIEKDPTLTEEKLKQDLKDAIDKTFNVTVVKEESTEDFVSRMDKLSEEELTKIKEKLAELEKTQSE